MPRNDTRHAVRRRRARQVAVSGTPNSAELARAAQTEQNTLQEPADALYAGLAKMANQQLIGYLVALLQKAKEEKQEALENFERLRIRKEDLKHHIAELEHSGCCIRTVDNNENLRESRSAQSFHQHHTQSNSNPLPSNPKEENDIIETNMI